MRSNNGASITINDSNIDAGSLTGGSGGTTGSTAGSSIYLPAGNTTISVSNSETIPGSIADDSADANAGSLTKTGAGILTLTGTNTYMGGTTTSGGTLIIGNGATSGSVLGNIVANGNVSFYRSDNITFGGNISGAGALIQAGTGTLTLTGGLSYGGGTSLNNGDIDVVGHSLPGGIIELNGNTLEYDTSSATVFQVGSTIRGAGTLEKVGGNFLVFGSGGTVNINLTAGAVIDVEGGTLNGSSSYQANWSSNQASLNIASGAKFDTVEGGSTQTEQFDALTGSGAFQGGWSGNTNATTAVTLGVAGGGGTFSGTIQDDASAHLAITKVGSGTQIFTGNCTYTGGTTISDGTLQIGNGGSTGTVAGNIADNAALIFDRSGSSTYSGNVSGTGSLKLTGAGTVIFTGANSQTGGTTIASGTLQIGNGGTAGSIAGNITDNANLAFNHSDNISYSTTISGSGSLTQNGPGILNLSGPNTYTGGTILNGGILSLNADNVLGNGTITINGGNIRAGGAARTLTNAVNIKGSFTIGRLTTFNGTNTLNTNATIYLDNPDGPANSLSTLANLGQSGGTYSLTVANGPLYGAGTGALVISGNATYTGGTTISSGALQLGIGGSSGSVMGGITDNASLIIDRSDNPNFSTAISGTGSLSLTGTGTIILTGNNTYSGATTISSGALQIGNGSTAGSITGPVTDNASLVFDRSDASSYSGIISGSTSATITKLGAGTLTLTGANTLFNSGTVATVSAGTLQFGNGGTSGMVYGNITDNAGVAFDIAGSVSYGSAISGSGSVTKLGSGIFEFNQINTYTGGTIISGGLAVAENISAIGSGQILVHPNATLQFANTFHGTLTIPSLAVQSSATLDLGKTDLLVNYTGTNLYPTILTSIKNAYDHGQWDTAGITSSSIAAGESLGIYDNSIHTQSTLDDITSDATTILIKLTWIGDANCDGVVNPSDLTAMSSTGTTWQTGDFNYDGKVNADDYSLFMLGEAKSSGANISTKLPEPAGVLLILSIPFLYRRRFRQYD